MTSYHGGKQKIGREIAEVISTIYGHLKEENVEVKGYCEPFCGMLGVYQYVHSSLRDDPLLRFNAGDINESLILMWKKAQKGWIPPVECSEERYNELKAQKRPSAEKGFIGHQYSYGGQYFKGYRGKYKNKSQYKKASDNVRRMAKQMKDVVFTAGKYTQFSDLKNYIIYCDPPYMGSKENYYFDEERNRLKFDHTSFWRWCLDLSKNNIVFVSDYRIPEEVDNNNKNKIKIVFSKKVKMTGSSPIHRERTEKLYMILPGTERYR